MNAADYRLSLESVKQLRVQGYLASHLQVLFNLCLLAAGILLFRSESLPFYLAGSFLLALQMNHSYLIVHECGHSSFVKSRAGNEVYGNIFAFLSFLPFYSRRYEHSLHHRFTGTFQEPSTRRAMSRFSTINPRIVRFLSVCWKLWIPVFSFNEHIMLWGLALRPEAPRKMKMAALVSAGLYMALAASVVLLSPAGAGLLLKYLLAVYLYFVLIEFFNLPHHLISPIDDLPGPIPFHDQARYSRSCAPLPAPFGALLTLNFNYHIAHHFYPNLHWRLLPAAHRVISAIEPDLDALEHEWTLNREMRRMPIRRALSKYFDQQEKAAALEGLSRA